MIENLDYTITTKIWVYQGKGAWFFATVPKTESEQIKFFMSPIKRGWGSVPVQAKIGTTTWKTSIFPDSKSGTYLLPIKAEVRKKEKLGEGDTVNIWLNVFL